VNDLESHSKQTLFGKPHNYYFLLVVYK